MNLYSKIRRKKLLLTKKAKDIGLYENFGQNEVYDLEIKYIDISDYTTEMNEKRDLIKSFNNWCMNFDLSQL